MRNSKQTKTTKHAPQEYRHIAAWGSSLGSFGYYIADQQAKAAAEGAPLTAVYRAEDRWVTIEECHETTQADITRRLLPARMPALTLSIKVEPSTEYAGRWNFTITAKEGKTTRTLRRSGPWDTRDTATHWAVHALEDNRLKAAKHGAGWLAGIIAKETL